MLLQSKAFGHSIFRVFNDQGLFVNSLWVYSVEPKVWTLQYGLGANCLTVPESERFLTSAHTINL